MQVIAQAAPIYPPVVSSHLTPPPCAGQADIRVDPLDALRGTGAIIRYSRDQLIHADGTSAEHGYRVLSGCVRTVRLLEDGRRHVGEFLLPGDLFGVDDFETHAFGAEAVCPTSLARFPRRMIDALAREDSRLFHHLRSLTLAHLRRTQERLVLLGRKTAVERVASFTLELDRRTPTVSRTYLELPMSRTDVADYLGLTVETVCRVLAHLKRDGTIDVSRTGLYILDRTALRRAAAE
jgi:CRP/FNR family transcriptional regulator, nitrogen fixation regulation protein